MALPTGLAALVALPLLTVLVLLLTIGAGYVLLPPALERVLAWAEWERGRARTELGAAPEPGLRGPSRLRDQVRDPQTRRALLGLLAHAVLGTSAGLVGLLAAVGVPGTVVKLTAWRALSVEPAFLGIPAETWGIAVGGGLAELAAFSALFLWGTPAVAGGYARLLDRLLSPSAAELQAARLSERVEELSHTRAEALDAHGAELRRIERDLHDGTQARLVELAMRAGVAERMVADDPERAAELLGQIRGRAEDAMTELRDVIRTMYPPILADRGLEGAVSALAARCPLPTRAEVGSLGEVPASVQAAAYYVVAESLTNAAKHAAASSVEVRLERSGPTLRVQTIDDGIGGAEDADSAEGTGLGGMRRRVAALDGTTSVVSPAGGPTVITVEIPCES
ncbi:sensor histidine kinase [Streptomonospora litoralis]|uniref:sensor histidine kinase n=1 Tax=Streptomonospora litoralis TaxID=2498135 RepID=UPI001F61ABB6|nr:sensor histidine kinase [Streptomonospora litoralis]